MIIALILITGNSATCKAINNRINVYPDQVLYNVIKEKLKSKQEKSIIGFFLRSSLIKKN